MEAGEVWRAAIPGLEASTLGRIRVAADKRILKPYVMNGRDGHLGVSYGRGYYVHRLVAQAFHGPGTPERRQVGHRDGDTTNNRPDNVRWVSPKENAQDRTRHGKSGAPPIRGHGLCEDEARLIKRRLADGWTSARIAREHNMTPRHIRRIKNGECWAHVA